MTLTVIDGDDLRDDARFTSTHKILSRQDIAADPIGPDDLYREHHR